VLNVYVRSNFVDAPDWRVPPKFWVSGSDRAAIRNDCASTWSAARASSAWRRLWPEWTKRNVGAIRCVASLKKGTAASERERERERCAGTIKFLIVVLWTPVPRKFQRDYSAWVSRYCRIVPRISRVAARARERIKVREAIRDAHTRASAASVADRSWLLKDVRSISHPRDLVRDLESGSARERRCQDARASLRVSSLSTLSLSFRVIAIVSSRKDHGPMHTALLSLPFQVFANCAGSGALTFPLQAGDATGCRWV